MFGTFSGLDWSKTYVLVFIIYLDIFTAVVLPCTHTFHAFGALDRTHESRHAFLIIYVYMLLWTYCSCPMLNGRAALKQWVWELLSSFSRTVISLIFPNCQSTLCLLNMPFICDICRRSSAAVTPVRNECDSKNLISNFTRTSILLTGFLTNGNFVNPPQLCWMGNSLIYEQITLLCSTQ